MHMDQFRVQRVMIPSPGDELSLVTPAYQVRVCHVCQGRMIGSVVTCRMCQGQCHVHCATTWQGGGMICELCVSQQLVTAIPRTGQYFQPRFPSLTIADEDMARYAHITTEVGRSAIQGAQLGGMLLGGATTAVVQGGVRLVSAAMSQGRDILR